MEWLILVGILAFPYAFIYFLLKSIYQVIHQARDNEPKAPLEITGSMHMACLTLTLSILSIFLLIAMEF